MKNKLLFLLASFVTLLLGPGAGHLIVKEWKKATIFISVSFCLVMILAVKFIAVVGHETLDAVMNSQDIDQMVMMNSVGLEQFKEIFYKFKEENTVFMWFFNISFAALWAYSIYDLFRKMRKDEQE